MRGQADLRYVNSYAEETKRLQLAARHARRCARSRISIRPRDLGERSSDEHIHFTDAIGEPDYNRYSVFGRYTRKWTKVDLTADLGYMWLNYIGQRDRRPRRAARDAPPHLALEPNAARSRSNVAYQFSDAAPTCSQRRTCRHRRAGSRRRSIAVGDATTTSQAYLEHTTRRRLSAMPASDSTFNVASVLSQARLLGRLRRSTDRTRRDRSDRRRRPDLSFLLRPLLTAGLRRDRREPYATTASGARTRPGPLSAILSQQWTRNWSGRLELTHYDRNSNVAGPEQRPEHRLLRPHLHALTCAASAPARRACGPRTG